jgi:hypothetical protein
MHELHITSLGRVGEDGTADGPDLLLHPADHPGLEAVHQRPPVGGVAGRVHHQQHVATEFQLLRRRVLQNDALGLGREYVRVAGHMGHIGVLENRPVARLARHLLPVHRLATA